MNYRHIYHAGGIADVFKHLVLIALLDRLGQKEAGFFVADTHAGVGLYDLSSVEAQKTGEWRGGIGALAGRTPEHPLIRRYLNLIAVLNNPSPPAGGEDVCRAQRWQTGEGPSGSETAPIPSPLPSPPVGGEGVTNQFAYPGSPWIIAQCLRAQDRAIACELHPEDHAALRRAMAPFRPRLAVHLRDGYEAIGAFLPPKEKRGLVFIDPPFERTDEFETAVEAIAAGYAKFPTGVFALWYPVKDRAAIWRFHEAMIATGIARLTAIEFMTAPERDPRQLNGSGVLLVNAPYGMTEVTEPALQEVQNLLAPQGRLLQMNCH